MSIILSNRFKKTIASLLSGAMLLPTVVLASPEEAKASSPIVQNPANHTVSVNAGNLSLVFDYDHKLTLSSMKLGGSVEVLEPGQASSSGVLTDSVSITALASYTNSGDNIDHLKDGIISYSDNPRNRWTAYRSNKQPVAADWVEYDFDAEVDVDSLKVYYFEDLGYTAALKATPFSIGTAPIL